MRLLHPLASPSAQPTPFPAPRVLDSRRCLAYLTIEHDGPIPHEFRRPMGNRIFGCDDCLAVCPWNRFAEASRDVRMALRPDLAAPPLADLARLDEAAFRARFAGTPVRRTGRDRAGPQRAPTRSAIRGEPALAARARRLLDDPAPIVRGAAGLWAWSRLVGPGGRARRGRAPPGPGARTRTSPPR